MNVSDVEYPDPVSARTVEPGTGLPVMAKPGAASFIANIAIAVLCLSVVAMAAAYFMVGAP